MRPEVSLISDTDGSNPGSSASLADHLKIDLGCNSYNDAEQLVEELEREEIDLRNRLQRSYNTDEYSVRSTLIEYLKYKSHLHLIYLKPPKERISDRIMMCLCLCRILTQRPHDGGEFLP